MHSFLVDNSEHKKPKGMNGNVVATINHNEYQDALSNNICIRHSMNRSQGKDHRIETNKISLALFEDKIYIQNNRYDRQALGYQS